MATPSSRMPKVVTDIAKNLKRSFGESALRTLVPAYQIRPQVPNLDLRVAMTASRWGLSEAGVTAALNLSTPRDLLPALGEEFSVMKRVLYAYDDINNRFPTFSLQPSEHVINNHTRILLADEVLNTKYQPEVLMTSHLLRSAYLHEKLKTELSEHFLDPKDIQVLAQMSQSTALLLQGLNMEKQANEVTDLSLSAIAPEQYDAYSRVLYAQASREQLLETMNFAKNKFSSLFRNRLLGSLEQYGVLGTAEIKPDLPGMKTTLAKVGPERTKAIIDESLTAFKALMPDMLFEVQSRIKSVSSTGIKLGNKGGDDSKIHDKVALRLILGTELQPDNISDYKDIVKEGDPEAVLRAHISYNLNLKLLLAANYVLTDMTNDFGWAEDNFRIRNYVNEPRKNGYQSYQRTFRTAHGLSVEFQLRTYGMHRFAELGGGSHRAYKAGETGAARDMRGVDLVSMYGQLRTEEKGSFFGYVLDEGSALTGPVKLSLAGNKRPKAFELALAATPEIQGIASMFTLDPLTGAKKNINPQSEVQPGAILGISSHRIWNINDLRSLSGTAASKEAKRLLNAGIYELEFESAERQRRDIETGKSFVDDMLIEVQAGRSSEKDRKDPGIERGTVVNEQSLIRNLNASASALKAASMDELYTLTAANDEMLSSLPSLLGMSSATYFIDRANSFVKIALPSGSFLFKALFDAIASRKVVLNKVSVKTVGKNSVIELRSQDLMSCIDSILSSLGTMSPPENLFDMPLKEKTLSLQIRRAREGAVRITLPDEKNSRLVSDFKHELSKLKRLGFYDLQTTGIGAFTILEVSGEGITGDKLRPLLRTVLDKKYPGSVPPEISNAAQIEELPAASSGIPGQVISILLDSGISISGYSIETDSRSGKRSIISELRLPDNFDNRNMQKLQQKLGSIKGVMKLDF